MSGKAAIVGSGSFRGEGVDFSQYKFIAGCDGGTKYLSDLGVVPHVLMGDFDSLDPAVIMEMFLLGVARRGLPADKDMTDMKATLDFVTSLGYDEIDFYGATGTRLDHSMANLMLLLDLCDRGIKGRVINETNIVFAITAVNGPVEQEITDVPEGWYVSFIPIGKCRGVEIRGFKYDLDPTDMDAENAGRAISNEALDTPGRIRLEAGRLLAFFSKD